MLRLYRGQTSFDFIGRRKWWFAISAIIILAGVLSFATRGLNLGIDFKGGQSWTISNTQLTVAQATTAVENAGVSQPTVVLLTNQIDHTKSVEVQADLNSQVAGRPHGHREERRDQPGPGRPHLGERHLLQRRGGRPGAVR